MAYNNVKPREITQAEFNKSINEEFGKLLAEGMAPFQRTFKEATPVNGVSGTLLHGQNAMRLLEGKLEKDFGSPDPRWFSQSAINHHNYELVQQAKKEGRDTHDLPGRWNIKQGSHSVVLETVTKAFGADRQPALDSAGKPIWNTNHPRMFHASQLEGIPPYEPAQDKDPKLSPKVLARAEAMLAYNLEKADGLKEKLKTVMAMAYLAMRAMKEFKPSGIDFSALSESLTREPEKANFRFLAKDAEDYCMRVVDKSVQMEASKEQQAANPEYQKQNEEKEKRKAAIQSVQEADHGIAADYFRAFKEASAERTDDGKRVTNKTADIKAYQTLALAGYATAQITDTIEKYSINAIYDPKHAENTQKAAMTPEFQKEAAKMQQGLGLAG